MKRPFAIASLSWLDPDKQWDVFVPALIRAPGFLLGVSAPDVLLFLVAMAVAILYDYYRLNPERNPLHRR